VQALCAKASAKDKARQKEIIGQLSFDSYQLSFEET
jgi:hypothetical protein